MKILAINASHRGDNSHTRFLIDQLFKGAAETGAQCEVITLSRYKINRCLACQKCHQPEQYLHCVYEKKDDVSMIFDKMRAADIIIYATPVYVFSMSGLQKIFLDRFYATGDSQRFNVTKSGLMFHHIDTAICSKRFVALISGNYPCAILWAP